MAEVSWVDSVLAKTRSAVVDAAGAVIGAKIKEVFVPNQQPGLSTPPAATNTAKVVSPTTQQIETNQQMLLMIGVAAVVLILVMRK